MLINFTVSRDHTPALSIALPLSLSSSLCLPLSLLFLSVYFWCFFISLSIHFFHFHFFFLHCVCLFLFGSSFQFVPVICYLFVFSVCFLFLCGHYHLSLCLFSSVVCIFLCLLPFHLFSFPFNWFLSVVCVRHCWFGVFNPFLFYVSLSSSVHFSSCYPVCLSSTFLSSAYMSALSLCLSVNLSVIQLPLMLVPPTQGHPLRSENTWKSSASLAFEVRKHKPTCSYDLPPTHPPTPINLPPHPEALPSLPPPSLHPPFTPLPHPHPTLPLDLNATVNKERKMEFWRRAKT